MHFTLTTCTLQSLQKVMDETFPGMKFESVIVQPTRLLDSKVVLVLPEELPNWEIRPKRLPPAVSTCDIFVHIVCSVTKSFIATDSVL